MTEVAISNAPDIPGLIFRHFQGDVDYPGMVAVIRASAEADGAETTVTVEALAQAFQNLRNCDPFRDILLAVISGEIIGYTRGWWIEDAGGELLYRFNGFLAPAWRRKGIGSAMLGWTENRLREVAAGHPPETPKFFRPSGVDYRETGTIAMLTRAGYQPIRYYHNMVRPTLEDIQDFPLPEGLEVRQALPEHYRAIWANVEETGEDEWGNTKPAEEEYQRWLAHPHFQPELWQIAWDFALDKPVAHVLTFIDQAENEQYNRKRGYTEGIGVDRAWRRRGVARALISLSLKAQKAAGMGESALVADSDSSSNVTSLYERCGFQTVYTDAVYQKAF
jgi:mycothiol synthase